jgi:hypothetical protein
VQELKQNLEIAPIDEGMQIARSDEQWENADSPKFKSLQPVSKVKVDNVTQF